MFGYIKKKREERERNRRLLLEVDRCVVFRFGNLKHARIIPTKIRLYNEFAAARDNNPGLSTEDILDLLPDNCFYEPVMGSIHDVCPNYVRK